MFLSIIYMGHDTKLLNFLELVGKKPKCISISVEFKLNRNGFIYLPIGYTEERLTDFYEELSEIKGYQFLNGTIWFEDGTWAKGGWDTRGNTHWELISKPTIPLHCITDSQ